MPTAINGLQRASKIPGLEHMCVDRAESVVTITERLTHQMTLNPL
jgi:hypothetical protein